MLSVVGFSWVVFRTLLVDLDGLWAGSSPQAGGRHRVAFLTTCYKIQDVTFPSTQFNCDTFSTKKSCLMVISVHYEDLLIISNDLHKIAMCKIVFI